jgi:hypothetical protein
MANENKNLKIVISGVGPDACENAVNPVRKPFVSTCDCGQVWQ